MARTFYDGSSLARDIFRRADSILGFPLSTLCRTGSEAELRRTENAQPALFTLSAVACALLGEREVVPDVVAGHSVGEYAALLAADALDFEEGLHAVRRRGELMAAQSERTPGSMAAIMGLSLEVVERLCAHGSAVGIVQVANENGPGQTVVSGEHAAVDRVMDLAEEEEGGIALPLSVSGPFHSSLMAPVSRRMAEILAGISFRSPRIPVIANYTAEQVRTPEEVRDALVRQISGRVRWGSSLLRIAAAGPEMLIEVGPGRALSRLAREIVPHISTRAAEDLLAAGRSAHRDASG
jgi:[acyl-carrier-protein] S-malonyltransferase